MAAKEGRPIKSGELSLLLHTLRTMEEGAQRLDIMRETLEVAEQRELTPEDLAVVEEDLREERRLLAAVARRLCIELQRPCRRSRQGKVNELREHFAGIVSSIIASTEAQLSLGRSSAEGAELAESLKEWRREIQNVHYRTCLPQYADASLDEPRRRGSTRKRASSTASSTAPSAPSSSAAPAPDATPLAAKHPFEERRRKSSFRSAMQMLALSMPAAACVAGVDANAAAVVGCLSVLTALVL